MKSFCSAYFCLQGLHGFISWNLGLLWLTGSHNVQKTGMVVLPCEEYKHDTEMFLCPDKPDSYQPGP